ncbi:helix-turn-helix domain-containing protein [Streptomyces cylindrosporus]|uniref:Helix-turn-helix transcriptional regulator n=1 Tax=Streptomyces cylindrosporus TaxID=2927583 RepID=A0ABS9Y907_9ACTN|nr:helix-turn-helix transcriptional regulator [Streptomyces cylindrosporus]MCI3273707.1 helix-turn-helix transcriptional regulator [Streptomyces cylindrosporus]
MDSANPAPDSVRGDPRLASLGEYLRARRAQVRPEDSGLPVSARRRVAGLRREEVAMLAGVSTDYYVRLEQGRERNPSAQVLDALAGALHLDADATEHLHRLARPARGRDRTRKAPEQVSPVLLRMMDRWHSTPAVVLGRRMNVLAHNPLGRALFAGHTYSDDLLRLVFLDPDAHEFYPDWERAAANTVGALRAAAGTDHDDPHLIRTVGELSLKSPEFRRLWARHDIRRKTHETKRLRHPLVGELTLDYESFTINSAPGRQLVVYEAAPNSPSAEALALLGSLTADRPAEERTPSENPSPGAD